MKQHKSELKKRMLIMLLIMGALLGSLLIYHLIRAWGMKHYFASMASPIVTVSAMPVTYSEWQFQLKAVANLRAVRGVNVTPELAGMIKTIDFAPGAVVKKGDLLLKLNTDPETAQLQALQASSDLAKVTYTRDKAQYFIHAVSKATLDSDEANYKNATAQVAKQHAVIEQKTVRAPFDGRLGICLVNPGQFLNPGDKITSLEALAPIYADFSLPQQALLQIQTGQTVSLSVDTYPQRTFTGTLTTLDSAVDNSTRNIQVEATFANHDEVLIPGMFASVTINAGNPQRYLTLPQTAVSFNPYGEIIYVLTPESPPEKKKKKSKKEKVETVYIANQHFVNTGEVRGDQVAILAGLKEGDLVVTSGQLKLKNKSRVVINNQIVPDNQSNPPSPIDE
ncbi:MAG: efflux RND transporter periplasmic adaptor subunit [Gammaproteobacteria bacterium]|nr:efflux RND transporter periplasmic adaptor subunit [Gammaproteobacteria bacterium]